MPTVAELIERLNYYVDDEIELEQALMLFNECLEDLSEVAGYAQTKTTYLHNGDRVISMPHDLVELVDLRIRYYSWGEHRLMVPLRLIDQEDIYPPRVRLHDVYGYRWFGDQIELVPPAEGEGELLIHYYANLPSLTSEEDVPALRTRFHRLLPIFAAIKYETNWRGGDSFQSISNLSQEYAIGKAELDADTRKRRTRTRSRTVYLYRSWE